MKLKAIAIALGVVAAGYASADMNSQLSSLQAQVNQLQSQVNSMGTSGSNAMSGVVGLNSDLSMQMMGNQMGVGKELNLLQARQKGLQMLTIGGYAQADAVYDYSSPEGNFINPAINSAAGQASTATSTTRLELSNVNLATTAAMGNWVTGYIQVGKSAVGEDLSAAVLNPETGDYAGSTSVNNNFGIQDAYLVFGNLSQMPVYGFIGNKDIDFGSFQTVDIYNQPLNRTLFEAHGNTAGVGLNAYGFNGTFSLMNGGSESSTPVYVTSNYQYDNLNTTNNTSINNYAVNLSYGMTNGPVTWDLGAGYLAGGSYLNNTTNTQHPTGETNGVWDVNGKVSVAGFDLLAEYDSTASNTYDSQYVLGNNNSAARAQAWDVGADYNFNVMGYTSAVNADYSGANLGSGSNLGNNTGKGSQYVLGYRVEAVKNVWAGLEYAYTKGVANYLGDAGGVSGNVPYYNDFSTTGYSAGNVKNSTVALDVTAAF